jgi:hypothetical protein
MVTADFGTFTNSVISVRSVNTCGMSAARTLSVTGTPGQSAPINFTTLNPCINTSSDFSVPTVTGADTYTWTLGAGGVISSGQGSKNITVQWLGTPLSNLSLQVITSNACGNSPVRSRSGINLSNCVRTIDDNSLFNLTMFPNPANDQITVQFYATEAGEYRLRISDAVGRMMFFKEGVSVQGQNTDLVNIDHLAAGIYHLELEVMGKRQQLMLMVK